MSDLETIRQFNANTVILQETEIAPLMQWLDIRGHSDAYQWDLLISQIQQQKLLKSNSEDLTGEAINKLWRLQMNLNQVKAKVSLIKQCREQAWWQTASLDDLEQVRIELRSIMQFSEKSTDPRPEVPIIDVTDSAEIKEHQGTYLKAVDMVSYRLKVEQALKDLFEQDPILQKIRNGAAVSLEELDNLNALIHIQHPDIDLNILKSFYDTAAPLEQILRSIVGMNADSVNQHFADFIQRYPSLNARQVQFLSLLKRQIAQSGAIEINNLYKMPFAALGELDSIFTNEQQIDDLLTLVQSFGKQPIMATQY